MKPFTKHRGRVAPLDHPNVDTDQIIPKQFLKRIERTGFGQYLFFDWRFHEDGSENPGFVLNTPEHRESTVLLARRNFGCGSSREHAPWALDDYGFRVVISPAFADIFYNNCFKNGMLPIVLSEEHVEELFQRVRKHPDYHLTIDLHERRLYDDHGFEQSFEVDDARRHRLLNGLDDIGLTLEHADKIDRYEAARGL